MDTAMAAATGMAMAMNKPQKNQPINTNNISQVIEYTTEAVYR